jgi:hypothetical protein
MKERILDKEIRSTLAGVALAIAFGVGFGWWIAARDDASLARYLGTSTPVAGAASRAP